METQSASVVISILMILLFHTVIFISYLIYRLMKNESVKNFFEEMIESLQSPGEFVALFEMKMKQKSLQRKRKNVNDLDLKMNDIDYCYLILNKVSRSFAMVIEELPPSIRDVICVFYLVLRGLDTIEDDMNYPKEKKIPLLKEFDQVLSLPQWSMENVGDDQYYQHLLKHFTRVIRVFQSFDEKYQKVIVDITHRMGVGMSEFVEKDYAIDTVDDYNLYCHYVAGLVGEGLSSIFLASDLEKQDLPTQLSNSMGLFLQKTNIIRDFYEDLQSGRIWWPRSIWKIYLENIEDLHRYPNKDQSLQCLNHLILDCLEHLPDVLEYLQRIENRKVFQFCAIPQLMAIATLDQLFQNARVFTSKVKIRKGLTCQLILNSSNYSQVFSWIEVFMKNIQRKIDQSPDSLDERGKEKFIRLMDIVRSNKSWK